MEIVQTKDSSPTLFSSEFNQTYHSIHGAISESLHVFIKNGIESIGPRERISIFEMGYGTGINAMLTYLYAKNREASISYESIEKFPVREDLFKEMTFEDSEMTDVLLRFNQLEWNQKHSLDGFDFKKMELDIEEYSPDRKFDIIYFDAFSPNSQPELWSKQIFDKMFAMLSSSGILTTYCAKGEVKRTLKSCGFRVESRPGPVGKREMTYAIKD
jgi:tRNA U34 5-methylaminomethyl-2-thiouridine-forming methyltransferase MnmC